jgi:IS5 family transposase
MLGKKDSQLSFGQMEASRRVPRDHFLRRIEETMNWQPIEQMLEELYASRRGRPSYPPLIMFKALLLEQWYGLSDPGLEEAIGDRISFQQFLGLSFHDPVPDETTICKFRGLLARKGWSEKLFEMVAEQLDTRGLVIRRGSLIDASLIHAHRKPGGDPDAKMTLRGRKVHYGYKAHVTVDQESEILRHLELTSANVHDSTLFVTMIRGDEQSVFADKAYSKDGRKSALREYGIFCGILDKARINKPLSLRQKKRNKRFSRVRSAVERVFGTFKRHYGMGRVRYVGLMRNRAHLFLVGICYNLKKMLTLEAAR